MSSADTACVTTIGFTKSSAERFFERLRAAGVRKVVDVRLNNTSQLAGFAQGRDLGYLLRQVAGIGYEHEALLAPTDEMLRAYRDSLKRRAAEAGWDEYRARFADLMAERRVEERLAPTTLHGACLLCSEATPERCHRRLVCDYLQERWPGTLQVAHL